MVQDKIVRVKRRKEPQRDAAIDNNAAWADLDVPDEKVIYAQIRSQPWKGRYLTCKTRTRKCPPVTWQ